MDGIKYLCMNLGTSTIGNFFLYWKNSFLLNINIPKKDKSMFIIML